MVITEGGLDGSTDEETDTEKTPEEVSASCVRKLNRLEVLLKHKLKEDKAMRNAMKKVTCNLDQKGGSLSLCPPSTAKKEGREKFSPI